MTLSKTRSSSAIVALLAMFASGCNDSTGPGTVDASSALQSLSLGLQALGTGSAEAGVTAPDLGTTFDAITPFLDQVNVSIDGSSEQMFGLGLRETFPDGTCEEDIFVDPNFPPDPGTCTPVFNPVVLMLWQAHSATELPDRLIFLITEAGPTNFDFEADPNASVALYMEGQDNLWISVIGTLSTQIAGGNQDCGDFPLPPYARSGDCNIAAFTEQGSVLFAPVQDPTGPDRISLEIPHQSLHGFWLNVTEVQQISATVGRVGFSRALAKRVNAVRLSRTR
ncbi:MAG: hypothetical protein ACJ785_02630 [Gemmatimonadaceae bacterium]